MQKIVKEIKGQKVLEEIIIKKQKVMEEIKKQTLTLMTAAFGFVAALVWKDAISAWLAPLYRSAEGATGLTMAALVLTVVLVVVTMMLAKFLAPANSAGKTEQADTSSKTENK